MLNDNDIELTAVRTGIRWSISSRTATGGKDPWFYISHDSFYIRMHHKNMYHN